MLEGWLLGKALGAATVMKDMKAKVHNRGGPGRRPALARARQGRRIYTKTSHHTVDSIDTFLT